MLEIKTMADIERFESENVITKAFSGYLQGYFEELRLGFDREIPVEDFSLEAHGHLLVLQDMEDCQNLEQINVENEEDLLELAPEFVNEIVAGSNSYHQVGILCNNEYMLILYVPMGLNEAIDGYFSTFVIEG